MKTVEGSTGLRDMRLFQAEFGSQEISKQSEKQRENEEAPIMWAGDVVLRENVLKVKVWELDR